MYGRDCSFWSVDHGGATRENYNLRGLRGLEVGGREGGLLLIFESRRI